MFEFFRKREFEAERFIKRARRYDPFEIQKYEELYSALKDGKVTVEQRAPGLRLIVISDTHGYLAFGEDRFPAFMKKAGRYDLCVARRYRACRSSEDPFTHPERKDHSPQGESRFVFGLQGCRCA